MQHGFRLFKVPQFIMTETHAVVELRLLGQTGPCPFKGIESDTILLESGDQVRYLGIDAPEVDHDGGGSEFMAKAAWKINRKTVKGRPVRLELDRETQDRYGRILGYVFLKDGRMVNDLLIQQGMAHVMVKSKGLAYWDLLLESQRKAMKKKKGIWAAKAKDKERSYLGNSSSFRFHRPDCSFGKKISKNNRVTFKKPYDAYWEGYSPCRHCKP